MADLRLLHLCSEGLRLVRWRKGSVTVEACFAASADGPAALARHLAAERPADRAARHLLLVDLPDEAFQLETLPRLHGRDRRQLIARRQAQLHLDTPYLAHRSLGPGASGAPRQERVLFAALTRPPLLAPWLEALRGSGIALAGIHGAAMLGEAIGARLGPLPAGALLACVSDAGLRISCLDHGELRFSRLVPHLTPDTADLWQAAHDEVQRTHRYLLGLRALERGAATPVFILAPAGQHERLRESCPDTPELRFTTVDLQALASRCGLRTPPDGANALPLVLHLAACTRRQLQFAPAAERREHMLDRAGASMGLAAAFVFSASIAVAAAAVLETRQIEAQAAAVRAERYAEEERSQAVAAATPVLPQPLEAVQALLARHAALQRASAGPAPFLQQLAGLLDRHPPIALRQLDWSAGSDAPARQHVQLALTATANPAPFLADLRDLPGIEISQDPSAGAADILRSAAGSPAGPLELEIRLSLPPASP